MAASAEEGTELRDAVVRAHQRAAEETASNVARTAAVKAAASRTLARLARKCIYGQSSNVLVAWRVHLTCGVINMSLAIEMQLVRRENSQQQAAQHNWSHRRACKKLADRHAAEWQADQLRFDQDFAGLRAAAAVKLLVPGTQTLLGWALCGWYSHGG